MTKKIQEGVSLIICCYNSALLLPVTIQHIAQQKIAKEINWELIVVDNNSADGTIEIAELEWKKYLVENNDFLVLSESRQGLTYARKKGVDAAKFSLIIFCDDDNWLDKNYVSNAYTIMQQNKTIAALGGKGIAVAENALPDWWTDYHLAYAVGEQASATEDISYRKYVWGAGMVVRTSLLKIVFDNQYPFLLTDRKGGTLNSGGDAEICARLLLMNYKLWYDEKLSYKHFITAQRLTNEYKEKMMAGHKEAYNSLHPYYKVIDRVLLPFGRKISLSFSFIPRLVYQSVKKKGNKNYYLTELGMMWGLNFSGMDKDIIYINQLRRFLINKNKNA